MTKHGPARPGSKIAWWKYLVGGVVAALCLALLLPRGLHLNRSPEQSNHETSADSLPSTANSSPVAPTPDLLGWKVGLFRVTGDVVKQIGYGSAQTNAASGDVVALDVSVAAEASQRRIVVKDHRMFVGSHESGTESWIDFSDPSGFVSPEPFGVGPSVARGTTPARRVSSAGRQFDVFEHQGDAAATATSSVLSRDETWIDSKGDVARLVRFTYVSSKGMDTRVFLTIADRDNTVRVTPPTINNATPAAAAIRRLQSANARHAAMRERRDDWATKAGDETGPFRRVSVNFRPARFGIGQPIRPAQELPADIRPAKKLPPDIRPAKELPPDVFTPSCEPILVEGWWYFPCWGGRGHPRRFPGGKVDLPDVGGISPFEPKPEGPFSGGRSGPCEFEKPEFIWDITAGILLIPFFPEEVLGATIIHAAAGGILASLLKDLGHCLARQSESHGEPHLRTFDGHSYDFQALGEFVYLQGSFEVQLRLAGYKGKATWASATAVRVGRHVFESYYSPPGEPSDPFTVIIDGSTRVIDYTGIAFSDGTFAARRHGRWRNNNLLIVDPSGSYVLIENLGMSQNIVVGAAHGIDVKGGLGGIPDGDRANDFTLRDGTALPLLAAQTIDGLYGQFARSWRVTPHERLFTQGVASDFLTDEYTSLPATITRLSDFSATEIEKARGECQKRGIQGALLDDCIYDVVATNNVAWADQAATSAAAWSLTGNAPSVVRNVIDIEAPQRIAAGSILEFAWKGPNAPDDVLFIAPPSMASNEFFSGPNNSHATLKGSPAKLVAPAQPGSYEIRYFSRGDVMSRTPLTVTDPEVRLDAPRTVVAGSPLEFAWKGPNAPNDLIFIAPPSMASSSFFPEPESHATQKGSPAKLVAPVKAGRYEIRYFSHNNGAVLARLPLAVTNAEVRLDAPRTVAAGSTLEFAWKAPNAPNGLIFIAAPSMASSSFFPEPHSHATQKGSPARLVAPAQPGSYEIRYFSRGDVMSRTTLIVTDPEVRLDAPRTVAAGSTLEFAWKGPNAPNDFIFIATPSMASNEFFPGHATQKGSPAKLVAPAKAGSYEIRYFSSANGTVLKKRALVVY